jgi:putative ABC transport system substrate-binding protein
LLGGSAVSWPLAARAQVSMPTIGFLNAGREDSTREYSLPAFRQGLRQTGFVEGQHVTIEYRWADGHYDRLPALVADLVNRQVAVIATTGGTASALAAKAATTTIPIIFGVGSDPIKDGLVTSFSRPNANVTGVSYFSVALEPKRLELLRELTPHIGIFGVLANPNFADTGAQVRELKAAARVIGKQLIVFNVSTEADFAPAFASIVEKKVGALLVSPDPFLTANRKQLVLLTTRYAIPTMFAWREFVAAGGLISYGTNLSEAYRQIGLYTGQVLKGAKPSDLPVQQSVKVELVINLLAAKTLGLDVPLSLLMRVDEAIES